MPPGEAAARLQRAVVRDYPNVSVVELEGCGHYPMHETPVWLATQLEAFLADR